MSPSPPFVQLRTGFAAGVATSFCALAVLLAAWDILERDWSELVLVVTVAVSLGLLARHWIRRGFDPPALRIVLDTADFGRLVRGQWVGRPGARIVLADIGFAVMARELRDAAAAAPYAGGETEAAP